MNTNSSKVMVGLSGGVDSAAAALLLKRQGYDVIAVFMKNWDEKDEYGVCTSTEDYNDARRVAEQIGVPFYSVNFTREYYDRVFKYFLSEYKRGRTPNPDILCNSEIKFKSFLNFSQTAGAQFLATGHYARLDHGGGVTRLLRAADNNKDQTYFLAGLNAAQLKNAMFPVGGMQKKEVRELAHEHGFINAAKKDSTGICFIGERHFKRFLSNYLPAKPGDIMDSSGRMLGKHDGLMYYTIGQRKGINIGGVDYGTGEPWFVVKKDVQSNTLIVQQGEGGALLSTALVANEINWICGTAPGTEFVCTAKFRYRQSDQRVRVTLNGNSAYVSFFENQRAVTTGQWVVFYDGENCLGGGAIDEVFPL